MKLPSEKMQTDRTIAEKQEALAEDFLVFDDWMDRYQLLLDKAKAMDALPEAERRDEMKVPGCQSQVWVEVKLVDGRMQIRAASDALITAGLIALLVEVYSGHTPAEIVAAPFTLAERIGLGSHLSPSRANGFANMVKRIRAEAARLAT